ncbi:U-box domain-containing protein 12 [Apostasia shenzhenica]|uniref:U-box domain-containing protein 12 n=1 Tax=Apostasia shenzhenica TaxID=1088818 RepID=A0A2I0AMV4_9ASPA|nr:U-box domain-containing protein 12 [Apostasia shenzhenica]
MKPPEGDNRLGDCRSLLASLSEAIPAVRSFRGRWKAISATLDRLRTAVNDIADLPGNELSDELLSSLSQTLAVTLSLFQSCCAPEPPAGRLRAQSDLAAAASFLDQHAADADLLLRSGALLDPLPPKIPASSACTAKKGTVRREALRNEARTLVTRLQIGSVASRVAALSSLMVLIGGDDKNVVIAAAQGLVPALVRFLDYSSQSYPDATEKAVGAIARVSSVESCRYLLVAEGNSLLSHLFRVLVEPDGSGSTKEKACAALETLTFQRDVAMSVGAGGSISVVLQTCRTGTPPAQATAAGVLKHLAAQKELRQNFLLEGAVPVLIQILRSGTVLAQENAAACLSNLIAGEEEQNLKLDIFQEGGLDCLRNYWETAAANHRDLEPAIRFLRNLSSSTFWAELILSFGFLFRIILALDSSSGSIRIEAARAVAELGNASTEKSSKEGVEQAVPRLTRMLEAKGAEEKEAAVTALASLMPFPICRRMMRKDEKGIINVIMLLDPLVCNVEKKHAVSVLLAISQARQCRKLVVAAGARGFMPWLESTQVEGAKRLSEILAKGKLLGVFPRS